MKILILLIVLLAGCIGTNSPGAPTLTDYDIDSFEECAAAGYSAVMESYPRQCKTPDGRTFVEELDEPVKPPETDAPEEVLEVDVVYRTDATPEPSYLFVGPGMKNPPWEGKVYMARSNDGLTFTDEKLFVDRAGVPNLLLTSEGGLIATFQYFSYEYEELFDVIAYTVSEDFGESLVSRKKDKDRRPGF